MTDRDWTLLLKIGLKQRYKKGEYIMREGHHGGELFQILHGSHSLVSSSLTN